MRISDWSSDVCSSDLWFVVHSSTMALLDLQITSHADTAVELTVYPLMRNGGRAYQQVTPHGDHLMFAHQEYPDAWTLGHDVPYTASIRNGWVPSATRSEERRGGKECDSTCRSRGTPDQ